LPYALRSLLYAFLEDPHESEKIIAGEEVGKIKDRIAQEPGENPKMEKLIRKKEAQEKDGCIALNLPVFDQGIVRK